MHKLDQINETTIDQNDRLKVDKDCGGVGGGDEDDDDERG